MRILFVLAEEAFVMPVRTKLPKRWTYFIEIASYIKRFYEDVQVLDCLHSDISHGEILEEIARNDYNVICFLVRIETIRSLLKLIPLVSKISPNSKILMYGDIVNIAPRFFKKQFPWLDYIVDTGDWEVSILDFIRQQDGTTQGLSSCSADGSRYSCITSDSDSFTDWSFPNIEDPVFSKTEGYLAISDRELTFSVSRGCPHNCSFCPAVLTFGFLDRRKPPAEVVDYMVAHSDRVDSYKLFSPTLTYDAEWVWNLCESLIATGRNFRWTATTRPDCLQNEELIRLMKQAGCYKLAVGIETLEQETNCELGKFADSLDYVSCVEAVVKMVMSAGITLKPLLMIGIKGQSMSSILDTIAFFHNRGVAQVRIAAYSPKHILMEKDKEGALTLEEIEKFDKMTYIHEVLPGVDEFTFLNLVYNHAKFQQQCVSGRSQ